MTYITDWGIWRIFLNSHRFLCRVNELAVKFWNVWLFFDKNFKIRHSIVGMRQIPYQTLHQYSYVHNVQTSSNRFNTLKIRSVSIAVQFPLRRCAALLCTKYSFEITFHKKTCHKFQTSLRHFKAASRRQVLEAFLLFALWQEFCSFWEQSLVWSHSKLKNSCFHAWLFCF